jgi:hypothetical protein
MAEQSRQMSPAHDFAGPDDSDAQFMIVFVAHTKTRRQPNSEGIAFDHGLGLLFNSKEFPSDLGSRSRERVPRLRQELVMFRQTGEGSAA